MQETVPHEENQIVDKPYKQSLKKRQREEIDITPKQDDEEVHEPVPKIQKVSELEPVVVPTIPKVEPVIPEVQLTDK